MTPVLERIYLISRFKLVARLLLWRKRWFRQFSKPKYEMVNIGGGLFLRPHWKVMDHVSPFYPFASQYVDVDVNLFDSEPFPFADQTIDVFYSAHTLEHIPQEYCANLLSEIHRTLKPGGVVRLNMPDYAKLRKAADEHDTAYFSKQIARGMSLEESVVEQIATECLDHETRETIVDNYRTMTAQDFATHYTTLASRTIQRDKAGYHINWFTYEKLAQMLVDSGFSNVYRSAPQKSHFAELRGEGGWLAAGNLFETKRVLGIDTTHPERSLFVEAVKS